jgi:hypothetical protein
MTSSAYHSREPIDELHEQGCNDEIGWLFNQTYHFDLYLYELFTTGTLEKFLCVCYT